VLKRLFLATLAVVLVPLSAQAGTPHGTVTTGSYTQPGGLTGLAARIASPVIAWTNDRDAPPVAPRTFREIWKSEQTDRRTSTSDD